MAWLPDAPLFLHPLHPPLAPHVHLPPLTPCSTPPEQRSNGTQLMEEFMRRQQQGGSGATTPGAEVRLFWLLERCVRDQAAMRSRLPDTLPCSRILHGTLHAAPTPNRTPNCSDPPPLCCLQGSELAGISEAELQEKAKRKVGRAGAHGTLV